MTDTTLIAIPCRVITLSIELGAESGASTLEELVLKAVAGGRATVRDLGELFSLPHRLMLDLVHGLWSRGFLAVDFASHALESTQAAEAVLGGQDGTRILAATVEQRKFLFDPVTGTILPYERGRDRLPYGALDMPLSRGISEDDLPQTELLRAVRQAVDADRRNRGVHRRVLNVSFANPVLSPPQAVRWNTVETVVRQDTDTGLTTAVPIELPPGWGRRALELFQSHVKHLVQTRPDSRFVRKLTSRQEPESLRPDSLRALMLDLDGLAEGLTTIPDDEVPSWHDRLRARSGQVLEELAEARRARCSAGGVAAGAGVAWVVADLIEQAAHQVVLALPHITYDALHPVLPTLELAVKRSVTLVFLWGDHQFAKLEPRVATALFDLQARYPENVLLEQRSSRCAASVVICDDRSAYVGSRSVLSDDTGSGVLVGPAEGSDAPPNCVTDLLSWARRTYPYWETGQRIALAPADFGRREGAVGEPDLEARRHRITLPDLDENWDEDAVAYRSRWSAAWGRVLQDLVAAVDDVHRGEPVVRAVWDGMYVDLAYRMIASAVERLAVTDDKAEPEACGERLAQQLTDLREKHAVVHLQHPPFSDGRRPDGKYADLLQRLGGERTLRSTRARARAVLSDHETVLGSWRPLGNRAVNPARGPAAAQLGLHIVGTAFTAEFARELGIPDWYGGDSTDLPAYLPPLPALASAPVDDDPWTVLADRQAAGQPPELLRRESAALLLCTTDDGTDRRKWSRWLLHDAWARGAFMEAYVLAPLLGDPGALPVDVAAAAVPLEHGPLGYQLYSSAVELHDAPPEHRTVALVGAVAEMLLHGGSAGMEVCEAFAETDGLGSGLPPAWLRLAAAATTCFNAERTPLPLQDVQEWAADQERAIDIRSRWAQLAAEVDDFEQATHHFNFQHGEKLHRGLFWPNQMLTVVREMARQAASPGRRSEAAAGLPRGELEARAAMDQLSVELGLWKIQWRNHMAYARKVAKFCTEARTLAALSSDGKELRPALLPVLNPHQRAFARHVEHDWHHLLAEAEGLGEPACHPAKALLEVLSMLPKVREDDA